MYKNVIALHKAKLAHEKFLKRMGLKTKTVAKNKPSNMPKFLQENIAAQYQANLSNTVQGGERTGSKKGILSDVIRYTEADREIALRMSKQVSIEYNKGGLQYISKETDFTKMGKKV
jgi:hypothetical protein